MDMCKQFLQQSEVMAQAVEQMAGPIAGGRVAPMWDNLATDWAIAAMKIACAAKKEDKHLTTHFKAREILCLAEILHDKQDILSITVSGNMANHSIA